MTNSCLPRKAIIDAMSAQKGKSYPEIEAVGPIPWVGFKDIQKKEQCWFEYSPAQEKLGHSKHKSSSFGPHKSHTDIVWYEDSLLFSRETDRKIQELFEVFTNISNLLVERKNDALHHEQHAALEQEQNKVRFCDESLGKLIDLSPVLCDEIAVQVYRFMKPLRVSINNLSIGNQMDTFILHEDNLLHFEWLLPEKRFGVTFEMDACNSTWYTVHKDITKFPPKSGLLKDENIEVLLSEFHTI